MPHTGRGDTVSLNPQGTGFAPYTFNAYQDFGRGHVLIVGLWRVKEVQSDPELAQNTPSSEPVKTKGS